MVLGDFPVPGRPTNLYYKRARLTMLAVEAGEGCLDIFLSSIIFVTPALARCDVGIRFSVRPSVRLSVHN